MMSYSEDESEILFEESDAEGSVELQTEHSIETRITAMREAFEDAMDHIVSRGGWGEYLTTNTFKLRVPVPPHLCTVLGIPDTDPESDSPYLGLILRTDTNGGHRLILEPIWGNELTEGERFAMALHRDLRVTDTSPYMYMKPFFMGIHNDLELVEILGKDNGVITEKVLSEAKESALRRLSLHSELHEGVFSLKEDRDKEILADQIVQAGCEVYDHCKCRNPVKRSFNVVMFNLAHFAERCYVCGVEHNPPNEDFIPAACCNDLCRFKACDRMNGQLYSVWKGRPGVFELIVNLAHAAASSPRASLIMQPMPPGFLAQNPDSIRGILQASADFKNVANENDLKGILNGKRDRFYELIWWLVASLPNHITPVDQSEIQPIILKLGDATVVGQHDVFRVSCQATSLNREFLHEKEKRGFDRYAYHGSPKENWYSILKHGPRVMSDNPNYRLNGKARGSGIYLGLHFTTSRSYTRSAGIVGICEVLKGDETEISKDQWCWVVKRPELVRVKYILVPKNTENTGNT